MRCHLAITLPPPCPSGRCSFHGFERTTSTSSKVQWDGCCRRHALPHKDRAHDGKGCPHRSARCSLAQVLTQPAYCYVSTDLLRISSNATGPARCCAHLPAEALPAVGQCLWSHEGGRPSRAGQQCVVALKLVADAKVCDLDMAIVPQQQVGGLDVSVHNLLVVHWKRDTVDENPASA